MSAPKRYRKKPVEVEAVRLTPENGVELSIWCAGKPVFSTITDKPIYIDIPTREGTMTAEVGDYIIRGVEGEYYPCKPEIFEKTYEEVTE